MPRILKTIDHVVDNHEGGNLGGQRKENTVRGKDLKKRQKGETKKRPALKKHVDATKFSGRENDNHRKNIGKETSSREKARRGRKRQGPGPSQKRPHKT